MVREVEKVFQVVEKVFQLYEFAVTQPDLA